METVDKIIDGIIHREGGYVDHPNDRGGPTKYGITMKTLAGYMGHAVSKEDVFNLSESKARRIYYDIYVMRSKIKAVIDFDHRLGVLVLDAAVHSGPARAIQWLQEVIGGVSVDGKIGPQTLGKLLRQSASGVSSTRKKYLQRRLRYLASLMSRKSQRVFAAGWANRVAKMMDLL